MSAALVSAATASGSARSSRSSAPMRAAETVFIAPPATASLAREAVPSSTANPSRAA